MINEEKLLRENIRKIIQIIQTKKNNENNEVLQEEAMLRKIVRKLLSEEAVADFAPNQSTGINVLEELLKKIIPVLEEDFKSLTTNREQRNSFRAHIVSGIEGLLAPAEVNADAPTPGETEALEELLNVLNEVEVTIGGDDEMPEEFIDISGEEEVEEPATEEEEFGAAIADREYNLTGRNMALRSFKKIRQNILDSYDVLADDEDREIFYDYLITNVKLYFDRFEEELSPTVDEPTTPEYEEATNQDTEEVEEFNLDEYIDLDGLLESIHR
jgi:hypothetical protein|tara:strand:+ start:506 stop:1321 length:816 start_codon:yes stop_codon:yes gene_type:complete